MALKQKFYSLDKILANNPTYSVIFGERSNGKTYAVLKYGLEQYIKNGKQMAYVRRWQDDFTGKRGSVIFDAHIVNGEIIKLTNGEWTGVFHRGSRWYLSRYDSETNKTTIDETPFCYGFSISSMEHDKSTAYPNITTIVFDEFITRTTYLPDEFVLFMNVVSTIVRHRTNVKIFMLGNTVNKYCPYFKEMGLNHISKMNKGDIDIYQYGENSGLIVAVEYCNSNSKNGKASDKYFAFDNPKLNMITGGAWEIDIYPHRPVKFAPKDIQFIYFIEFNAELLQCEIVVKDNNFFTYIHRKTGSIKLPESDFIFSPVYDSRPNWRRNILKPSDNIGKKIAKFFATSKVFYQDNEVGEIVRNYLMWCGKTNI